MDEQNENELSGTRNENPQGVNAAENAGAGVPAESSSVSVPAAKAEAAPAPVPAESTSAGVPAEIATTPSETAAAESGGDGKPGKKQKKLPSFFNDTFSERKFEHKLLDKIYVPADKDFVKSFYEKNEKGLYVPRKGALVSAPQHKRLKLIAKQIKKQKGRVRFVPLLVLVLIIAAIVGAVTASKNRIAKKALVAVVEGVAGAKCDIKSVDLRILDSRLAISEVAVANKSEPMTNLVEFSKLVVDFDLVQLLKGRFVADEISAEGIQVGTERSTSGELERKNKKKKPAASAEDSEGESGDGEGAGGEAEKKTPADIAKQLAQIVQEQTGLSKESFTDVFAQFNPETMVQAVYDQMESPQIIKNLQPQAESIVAGWQSTSKDFTQTVQNFTDSARSLVQTDLAAIQKDPVAIKQLLDQLNVVYQNAETIKTSVEEAAEKVKADAETVVGISKSMQDAVAADFELINAQVAALSNIKLGDMARLFSGELDGPAIQLIAKYMPMAQMALAKAEEFQKLDAKLPEKKPKQKKSAVKRSAGRTVEYRRDNVPNVLLRKIHLSGLDAKRNWALSGTINNISSDCNKLDKPVDLALSLVRNNVETEKLTAMLDMRDRRTAKAFTAALTSSGHTFDKLTIPKMENVVGLPYLSGAAQFSAGLGIDTDFSFDIDAALKVLGAKIEVKPFEPAFAYSMYTRAIETIDELNLNALADFSPKTLLNLSILTDIDKILAKNLSAIFKEELAAIRLQLEQNIRAEISALMGPLESQIAEFVDLEALIKGDVSAYNDMRKKVDAKIEEVKQKIAAEANAKANEAVKQVTDEINEQISNSPASEVINNLDKLDKLKDLKKLF